MDNKRKHIRFKPDERTYILINIVDDEVESGLCVTESQGGCSAVFLNKPCYQAGEMCYLKVGKLDPVAAEIRWVTVLDNDLVKVGFEYLS